MKVAARIVFGGALVVCSALAFSPDARTVNYCIRQDTG